MHARSATAPTSLLLGAAVVLSTLVSARPAWAQDGGGFTVGVAVGGNMTAGQAVPDGYDNEGINDPSATAVPSVGFGAGLAVMARRTITERSQLRFGARTGYGQGRALFDLGTTCDGPPDTTTDDAPPAPCVAKGALRGSAAYGSAVFGGEAHLGNPDAARPYLLGELGFGLARLWPRARAEENNALTCAVSSACVAPDEEDGAEAGGSEPETGRIAVGPTAVVGLGLALPSTPVRVEAAYVWHSLLGGEWSIAGNSPGTSLSMVEISVGYLFGG